MAGGAGGDDDEGITGINVTPLVDIMLVLLIIFMVTASYIVKPSIEVELPKAASGGDTLDTTLSLVLAKDGSLFLNGEATTREAIAARCKEVAAKDPKAQAIIAADNAALHGQVVSLIDLIRVNGVLKFAINIQPQDEK
jgi:biopolymer transport protein ExbD